MRRAACLCLLAGCRALRTPWPRGARAGPARLSATSQTLTEQDLLQALDSPEYAMDISSITAGSERETYIGQGSGVNEGTGIGALGGWLKAMVGKFLARKNRPVYEELWNIINDDCLGMVQEHVPLLEPRPTWFSDKAEPHTFTSDDGKCEATVAAYKGGRVDWITTCKFFSSTLGFGNLRIDGWSSRDTRAPHVAVHLCVVFNVLFIYIGIVPRTNLVLDDAYNDYVYGEPRASAGGKSLNDFHVECVEDKAFKQYVSKSHVVNAFMVAPTTLLYTIPFNKKNFAKVRSLAMDYMRIWLELLDDEDGVLLDGIHSKAVQEELLKIDVRTRQFCGRDPDTKNVANIFGLEKTDKLVRTLWGDPDDVVWKTR